MVIRLARAIILLALGIAMPAYACSVVRIPYLKHRPTDRYAVKAQSASVSFSKLVETVEPWTQEIAGTIRLRGIKCLSKPKGVRTCPTDLDIDFDVTDDDTNCPSYPAYLRPDGRVTDRYFYLLQRDGKWYVVHGARWIEDL